MSGEPGSDVIEGAEAWLLQAADPPDEASLEWDNSHFALLRCGRIFAAVRIAGAVVTAAAGTEEADEVDAYLRAALIGSVFVDRDWNAYYALMPTRGSVRSAWSGRQADVAYHGNDSTFLGVPRPTATPTARMRSCVPLTPGGGLCSPDAVSKVVLAGRFKILNVRVDVGGQ